MFRVLFVLSDSAQVGERTLRQFVFIVEKLIPERGWTAELCAPPFPSSHPPMRPAQAASTVATVDISSEHTIVELYETIE